MSSSTLMPPKKEFNTDFDLIIQSLNCAENAYFSICDQTGKIVFLSKGFEEIDGYVVEDAIGKSVLDVYKLGEEHSVHMIAINQKRILRNRLLNYPDINGKPIKLLMDIYPVYSGNEVIGSVAISYDKSKTTELTEKVLELQKALNSQKRATNNGTQFTFDDIIGSSSSMQSVISFAKKMAQSESRIMILGETGTGKELFAQSIHNHSSRAKGPFIAVNCSAIPDTLLESILFGTTKGAYTGAENKPGLFEEAKDGSLFLDEINSMSIVLQAKLLRALETNRVRRVGSNREIEVNPRIISAMNIDPNEAIETEKIRSDFYYRLAVVTLDSPPLREREGDILALSWYYIKKYNKIMGRSVTDISPEVVDIFQKYNWPGNVRELSHSIEHAMNMLEPQETTLLVEHLPVFFQNKAKKHNFLPINLQNITDFNQIMNQVETEILIEALKRNSGNISQAAKELNLSRQNLFYKLKRLNIDVQHNTHINID